MFIERLGELVRRQPGRPAVVVGGVCALTYGALWTKAAGIARRLRERGVGPERLVALHLPKSPESIAALIGTWMARAAFVPLDPALPLARRREICEQARPALVVGQPLEGAAWLPVEGPPARGPLGRGAPSQLAYVFFTSGSSGRPKGVAVEQRGLVPMLDAQRRAFDLSTKSRVLGYLPMSFDASISDLGTALLSGASLHLDPGVDSVQALLFMMTRDGITHADLPPSIVRLMDPDALPRTLRTVIVGGEPCDPAVVRRLAGRLRLVNVYGPTEATVCTSLGRCTPQWSQPLLGQPLPHVRYHVLDEALREVETGREGELCIAGPALARGYLGQPELEAARFIRWRGRRLYRTGDRVRVEAGEYVFLGRGDRQVKVRGGLVAPEEVEAALREHPKVREAAVTVEGTAPHARLCAYVSGEVQPAAVREHLRARLPAWMVPHRIRRVARFPRTASGKIELEALRRRASKARATKAPADALEAALVAIFREVLDAPTLSATDDFFAAGGDSLTAMQVAVRAESAGLALSPQQLASAPTARSLAEVLEGRAGEAFSTTLDASTLREDAERLCRRTPVRPSRRRERGAILLTGATGFLGARVLRALLDSGAETVHCLVRARDEDEAWQRVWSALAGHAEPLSEAWRARVMVHVGDVSRPRLRLGPRAHARLGETVSDVYHCAAAVNLVLPYERLRAANVVGTAEVLRFVRTGAAKALHCASSLSVLLATDGTKTLLEESDGLKRFGAVHGGYAQSKFAAEWLVRTFARGAAGLYRFGLLTGDTRTGRAPAGDWLTRFIRGTARLGCVPSDAPLEAAFDMTPVDYAAAAMVHLARTRGARGGTFHIAGRRPARLGQLLEAMRGCGVGLRVVSRAEWRARVAQAVLEDGAAAAFLGLLRALDPTALHAREGDLFLATRRRFSCARTLAGLEGSGLRCPLPTSALLARSVRAALASEAPA